MLNKEAVERVLAYYKNALGHEDLEAAATELLFWNSHGLADATLDAIYDWWSTYKSPQVVS